MSWLSDESEIAKSSEELILKYNPRWSGAGGLHPRAFRTKLGLEISLGSR